MAEATKACPYCGEEILAVAIKCKHCKEFLGSDEVPVPEIEEPLTTAPAPPPPSTPSILKLRPCPNPACDNELTFAAMRCPKCGYVLNKSKRRAASPTHTKQSNQVGTFLVAAVVIGAVIWGFAWVMGNLGGPAFPYTAAMLFEKEEIGNTYHVEVRWYNRTDDPAITECRFYVEAFASDTLIGEVTEQSPAEVPPHDYIDDFVDIPMSGVDPIPGDTEVDEDSCRKV